MELPTFPATVGYVPPALVLPGVDLVQAACTGLRDFSCLYPLGGDFDEPGTVAPEKTGDTCSITAPDALRDERESSDAYPRESPF